MNSMELLKQKLAKAKKQHEQDKKETKELFDKLDRKISTYKTLRV